MVKIAKLWKYEGTVQVVLVEIMVSPKQPNEHFL